MHNKEKKIQDMISWVKETSPQPWEILFKIANEGHQELISIKLGKLLLIRWGTGELFKRFCARIYKKDYEIPVINEGGELLTRVHQDIVDAACKKLDIKTYQFIGKAFGDMPVDNMEQIFPALIERQLMYISNQLPVKRNYSINLEAPKENNEHWKRVVNTLLKNGKSNIRLELIERVEFPEFALEDLVNVCEQTGMRIYIDDLGSKLHALPEREEYLCSMLRHIGKYVIAVKIDFEIVRRMNDDHVAAKVVSNIFYFARFWNRNVPEGCVCSIIFESMPNKDRKWLIIVQRICKVIFAKIYWQTD